MILCSGCDFRRLRTTYASRSYVSGVYGVKSQSLHPNCSEHQSGTSKLWPAVPMRRMTTVYRECVAASLQLTRSAYDSATRDPPR
ncbi:hypothetical protein Hypma_003530 [Hypsizygus marmoreus]|uniref:Uncharacterized protein n=1 Tax=Hypsizygus marmoreus TaxID=39966 RepID=A0A369J5X1_HYPMA|nr:hypothetical protein Hypma_003530 [Hypsizygus marmoreus]